MTLTYCYLSHSGDYYCDDFESYGGLWGMNKMVRRTAATHQIFSSMPLLGQALQDGVAEVLKSSKPFLLQTELETISITVAAHQRYPVRACETHALLAS